MICHLHQFQICWVQKSMYSSNQSRCIWFFSVWIHLYYQMRHTQEAYWCEYSVQIPHITLDEQGAPHEINHEIGANTTKQAVDHFHTYFLQEEEARRAASGTASWSSWCSIESKLRAIFEKYDWILMELLQHIKLPRSILNWSWCQMNLPEPFFMCHSSASLYLTGNSTTLLLMDFSLGLVNLNVTSLVSSYQRQTDTLDGCLTSDY